MLTGSALIAVVVMVPSTGLVVKQETGAVRGVVRDKDFDVPLAGVTVTAVETGQRATTTEQGNFVMSSVAPGKYTLIFSKEGYLRLVQADVVVRARELTDVDVELSGEFTDMDELVVQDVLTLAPTSEASLLQVRFESAALLDSIGADMMSRAGASDAASALKLVAGTSVQDGKYAVVRGLPDRYVSSQMNGVRLPTADENKRAVELDQFPAAVIESLRVSKTFTPDQQGDASGGAVDVRLRGIPESAVLSWKAEVGANSQAYGRDDFLTYHGGGFDFFGKHRDHHHQPIGQSWSGAVGVTEDDAPFDFKTALAMGDRHRFENGLTFGGFASLFYERDSSHEKGRDDAWWVTTPGGGPMEPQAFQGSATGGDFKTALFDVTKSSQSVKWGGLGTLGLEGEKNKLSLTYLYTRTAEDTATLAIDTRGKEFFFPGYDVNDPMSPGNLSLDAAPYIRTETLDYQERESGTLQLAGKHELPFGAWKLGDRFAFKPMKLEWSASRSFADLDEPDKRQFSAYWHAPGFHMGAPPFLPPYTSPAEWFPLAGAASINLGNAQRIWKTIDENSEQFALDLAWPFEQWSGNEGYVKAGFFDDHVERKFNQDTFSNFGDSGSSFEGDFDDPWSAHFPFETHVIAESLQDVDYTGDQKIRATYGMFDLPLSSQWNVIGGARFESTKLSIVNAPEIEATYIPPGQTSPVALTPGIADVDFSQDDVLPALSVSYRPVNQVTLRASYTETVARQTFKELSPIQQQEFAGGPVFIGNPDLGMSSLKNYDLRADWTPYDGSLVSASWFDKDIEDPIEYVQRLAGFTYTTPQNFPKGTLSGYELEVRQSLGHFTTTLEGLAVGANATFIDSNVSLPADEIAGFESLDVPQRSRDMTNAPAHLYNLYATYDFPRTGTQLGIFYTIQGDTLIAGAGQSNGNFIPDLYAKEFDTLNVTLSHRFGKHVKLQLQAKNLTNPDIETVYRSDFIGDDVTQSSHGRGVDYAISLTVSL